MFSRFFQRIFWYLNDFSFKALLVTICNVCIPLTSIEVLRIKSKSKNRGF